MDKNKFCIKKQYFFIFLLLIVSVISVFLSKTVRTSTFSSNTKASTLLIPTSAYNQCGLGKPCPFDKYCLDSQGDAQTCVSNIKYDSVAIGTSATGKFSNGTTYRYFDSINSIYTYGKTAGIPNLNINTEYVINVSDQYPGEWWENITNYTVTVTGVTATPVIVLDPKNYPKDWRSKTITFTSVGKGTIKITLKRTDPSNGRVLVKNWTMVVNVVKY